MALSTRLPGWKKKKHNFLLIASNIHICIWLTGQAYQKPGIF
jgi:hypothetical protein